MISPPSSRARSRDNAVLPTPVGPSTTTTLLCSGSPVTRLTTQSEHMHRCGAAAWASVSHVICAIGFAPHPPLLIPEVASGAAVELDDLRESCDGVVRELVESSDELLIVGSAQGSVSASGWRRAIKHPRSGTMAAEQHPADIADALADAQKSAHHVAVLAMGTARVPK